MDIIQIIGWAFIYFGLFVVFSGSVGMMRFPDIFSRLHPAGVTDSLGAPMVIMGCIMQSGFNLVSLKLSILILLILITSPTACHALAKAAYWDEIQSKS